MMLPLLLAVVVGGTPLEVPREVTLLVSAEQPTLMATLLHRGWTPDDPASEKAHPLAKVLLGGRAPDLDLEHAGPQIDERFRLLLWKRPEKLRGMTLWNAMALKQGGIRPLLPPTKPPRPSHDARDRVLADFSFGLSQSRLEGAVTWVELAEAPPGAEDLLSDLPPPTEPPLQSASPKKAPLLAELPPIRPVSPEVLSRPETRTKRVALTFDACSTLDRAFYDDRVTRVLLETKTPATMFISGR